MRLTNIFPLSQAFFYDFEWTSSFSVMFSKKLLAIRQFIYLFIFKKMVRLVSELKSSIYEGNEPLLLCEDHLYESEIKVVHPVLLFSRSQQD